MVKVWSTKHHRYLDLSKAKDAVLDSENYFEEARRLQAEYMATLSPAQRRWEKFKMMFGYGKHQA